MSDSILYSLLSGYYTEMVNAKSQQNQETAALSFKKTVNKAVMQCEMLLQSWEPENLYESIQILDYDYDVLGHKMHFEITPDYVSTNSHNAQEHYLQLLEQCSLDETEKHLILDDYAQKTRRNQHETLPPHFHLIEFSWNRLKDKRDELEDSIYARSPEDYKAYYESLTQKYRKEVREKILSLRNWQCRQCHLLSASEYKEKTEGVKTALRKLAPDIPIEYMLQNGPDDTANFGQYLICVRRIWDNEKQIKAIQLMAAWQWLLRKMGNDPSDSPRQDAILENAFTDLLHNHLNMKDTAKQVIFEGKRFRRDHVIVGLMHYSYDKGVIKDRHLQTFIPLIAPALGISEKQVDNIRRTCSNVEKEFSTYHCKLKELNLEHIKKQYSCAEENKINELYDNWNGLYSAIDTAAQNSKLFNKLITVK